MDKIRWLAYALLTCNISNLSTVVVDSQYISKYISKVKFLVISVLHYLSNSATHIQFTANQRETITQVHIPKYANTGTKFIEKLHGYTVFGM